MEVIGFIIALLLVAVVLGAIVFIFWLTYALFFRTQVPARPHRVIEDDDEDDPNWEDHIRHDPYHPGGNQ